MVPLLAGWRLVLVAAPAALVTISFLARLSWRWVDHALIRYVDIAREQNIPAWYSGGVLLIAGLAALAAYQLASYSASRGERVAWLGVAALLLVMSLDEVVSIHEVVGRALRPALTESVRGTVGNSLDGIVRTGWIIPGIVAVLLLVAAGAVGYRFAARRLRLRFVVGFGVFVLGALGMEMVGSLVYEHPIPLLFASHIEELLEMLGAAVMLLAVLSCFRLRHRNGSVVIDYRGDG